MKLKAKITKNKIIVNPEYKDFLNQFDGQDVIVKIIETKKDDAGLYRAIFYGKILNTCLESNEFGGWTKKEIEKYIQEKVFGNSDSKKGWSSGQWKELVENATVMLNIEHGIGL